MTILPEDYGPVEPYQSFAIAFRGINGDQWNRAKKRQCSVDHLSDAELAWCIRVMAAELQERSARLVRQAQALKETMQ